MADHLFAGIPVADYPAALSWYERLFGRRPSFYPHETEAVWEIAENRAVYIVREPKHAGHARHLIMVDDLDDRLAEIGERGLEPALRETFGEGVRKLTFRDPDGNEFSFGGMPS